MGSVGGGQLGLGWAWVGGEVRELEASATMILSLLYVPSLTKCRDPRFGSVLSHPWP